MFSCYVIVEILQNLHRAAGLGAIAIAGGNHEIEFYRDFDRPKQVCVEHDCTLQDAYAVYIFFDILIVARYRGAELVDLGLELLRRKHDFFHVSIHITHLNIPFYSKPSLIILPQALLVAPWLLLKIWFHRWPGNACCADIPAPI